MSVRPYARRATAPSAGAASSAAAAPASPFPDGLVVREAAPNGRSRGLARGGEDPRIRPVASSAAAAAPPAAATPTTASYTAVRAPLSTETTFPRGGLVHLFAAAAPRPPTPPCGLVLACADASGVVHSAPRATVARPRVRGATAVPPNSRKGHDKKKQTTSPEGVKTGRGRP